MSTIPLRIAFFLTFLRASAADCPATTDPTGVRLKWMDLMVTGVNFPTESGPSARVEPVVISPAEVMPETQQPTPGTVKASSTWNSTGRRRSADQSTRGGRLARKRRRMSRPSPETLEILKTGARRPSDVAIFSAHSAACASDLTPTGILRAPGDLRSFAMFSMVCLRMSGGAMSTFVTTTKMGRRSATAMARCSLVMRRTPMFAPTTSMQYSGAFAVRPNIVVLR
mmetsp:Transcript_11220/g.28370  ORF Transcript_11220/g.28370 Transcript_11220/m.28370 type:complete len:226 (+) Transcript_11220:680-1357(+)